ncbi:hypothetical protein [Donghicola sp.]|uniref:hypothetical protein n=1 Tax=Donghicola sp. TaxID=1929294 RepID=UPI0025E2DC30|nr:hypothetical protein [Donghicola sp.]MCT4578672.1 hypothetical protein [Donghicola sp.]
MKTFIATTAVVLGLAAPAFAENQLAADLNVSASEYTTAQLAQMHFNQDKSVSERNTYFGGDSTSTVSSKSSLNPTAEAIFTSLELEQNPALEVAQDVDTTTVYSSAAVNDRAAAIFADIDAND